MKNVLLMLADVFLLTLDVNYFLDLLLDSWADKELTNKMCQKLLIIISNNKFWVLDTNCSHLSPKKTKKKGILDMNFGPNDNKNAIETHS